MSAQRVLVSGAGGFVGHALSVGFASLGWEVTAVDVHFDEGVRTRLARVDLVEADLGERLLPELPRVDVVVHAAALTTDPSELGCTRAEHLAANMRPLLTVMEHAARSRPAAFVFLSSSGVFSDGDGRDTLTDADHPTGCTPYAVAKQVGERLVHAAFGGAPTPHVVRLGYVYGPHESSRPSRRRVSLVAEWLRAARDGRPLEVRADDPARDWTFAPDLAPALARLVDAPGAGRPLHLCSPHIVRDRALAALVSRRHPGTSLVTVPASTRVKPPMAPSDIAALRGFAWTDPDVGLARLVGREAVA